MCEETHFSTSESSFKLQGEASKNFSFKEMIFAFLLLLLQVPGNSDAKHHLVETHEKDLANGSCPTSACSTCPCPLSTGQCPACPLSSMSIVHHVFVIMLPCLVEEGIVVHCSTHAVWFVKRFWEDLKTTLEANRCGNDFLFLSSNECDSENCQCHPLDNEYKLHFQHFEPSSLTLCTSLSSYSSTNISMTTVTSSIVQLHILLPTWSQLTSTPSPTFHVTPVPPPCRPPWWPLILHWAPPASR